MSDSNTPTPPDISPPDTYAPSVAQRRCKAQFLARYTGDPTSVTLATASQFVRSRSLPMWWKKPGFVEWFTNSKEFTERLEASSISALVYLDELIELRAGKPSELIAAAKLILQASGKLAEASNKPQKYLDADISKMSEAELQQFLSVGSK